MLAVKLFQTIIKQLLLTRKHLVRLSKITLGILQLAVKAVDNRVALAALTLGGIELVPEHSQLLINYCFLLSELVGKALVFVQLLL